MKSKTFLESLFAQISARNNFIRVVKKGSDRSSLFLFYHTLSILEKTSFISYGHTKQRPLWTICHKNTWRCWIFQTQNGIFKFWFFLRLPIFLSFLHWYSSLKCQKILNETPYKSIVFPNRIIENIALCGWTSKAIFSNKRYNGVILRAMNSQNAKNEDFILAKS